MTLKIEDFHWINELVDKIIGKHGVYPEEVESALLNNDPLPHVWRKKDRYLALSQVEDDGEYLFIVLVMEPGNTARVISARSMSSEEKTRFRKIRGLV